MLLYPLLSQKRISQSANRKTASRRSLRNYNLGSLSRSECCCFILPAPTKQTECSEAGGQKLVSTIEKIRKRTAARPIISTAWRLALLRFDVGTGAGGGLEPNRNSISSIMVRPHVSHSNFPTYENDLPARSRLSAIGMRHLTHVGRRTSNDGC